MEIVIIGTGNVATVLGRKFLKVGHHILQVAGRSQIETIALAKEWETVCTTNWSNVETNADVYIIAVSDNAIEEVANKLRIPGGVIAHTAASVPKEILKSVTPHYGVFYPLQSLRKTRVDMPDIPILFDGSDDLTKKMLEKLAYSISNDNIINAGNDMRLKLHVAAVIVSNFTNYLYSLAEEYCEKEEIDFKLLFPLIKETATRIQEVSPGKSQTGPAIRHDDETIQKHLVLLEKHPEVKKLYRFLSDNISSIKYN